MYWAYIILMQMVMGFQCRRIVMIVIQVCSLLFRSNAELMAKLYEILDEGFGTGDGLRIGSIQTEEPSKCIVVI